jgi:hypothetical protein
MTQTHYPKPTKRRLRVFAFDPAASVDLDTAVINNAVVELPWERPWEDELEIGPVNDYLEVIDYDPNFGYFFEPVDLSNPHILAQDGLTPAESNPQFHQQMVFAVVMKTIRNFENALGRRVFWARAGDYQGKGGKFRPNFTKRLRIYPHALLEKNAYFSPGKAALLFGYFKGPPRFDGHEGDWVFTCLSQDIIAHETTHAILHGMRSRHIEAANLDSLAFHEGFADIIALFQHFTMANVLAHQLAKANGVLRSNSLLTGLASQFGEATGHNGPLRSAIELLRREQMAADKTGSASVKKLANAQKAHDRGQYLVAAVFDAFITIYEQRTADLFAIAGKNPGDANLPEKLIARLADEAAKVAYSFLSMCVRGLDYLPPGTSTFGDYLRAMITADMDLVPDDPLNYRVALAESFRKREIPVPGCASYAPIALAWQPPEPNELEPISESAVKGGLFSDALRDMRFFAQVGGKANKRDGGSYFARAEENQNLRDEAMQTVTHNQAMLHNWLMRPAPNLDQERMWEELIGIRTMPLELAMTGEQLKRGLSRPMTIMARRYENAAAAVAGLISGLGDKFTLDIEKLAEFWEEAGLDPKKAVHLPLFEVHSVRISRRQGPAGNELLQMFAQITQKRAAYFDEKEQEHYDSVGFEPEYYQPGERIKPDFWFRGGATLVVNLLDGSLQNIVRQRIDNQWRLKAQREFIVTDDTALTMAAMNGGRSMPNTVGTKAMPPVAGWEGEPFAFIHGDTP